MNKLSIFNDYVMKLMREYAKEAMTWKSFEIIFDIRNWMNFLDCFIHFYISSFLVFM